MANESGAPSGTGSHATHEAPDGSSPIGFDPSRDVRLSTRDAVMCALTDPGTLLARLGTDDWLEHEAHWQARAAIKALWEKGWRPRDRDRSGEADETLQAAQPEARARAGTASHEDGSSRVAGIEEAARVADEEVQNHRMAESNANAFNDKRAARDFDSMAIAAINIAAAIRSLKSSPPAEGGDHAG